MSRTNVEDRERMPDVLQQLTKSHFKRSFPPVKALRDLWQGWRDYRQLWLATGWYDVQKRYRRSVIGPFWITISMGVFIAALSFLYGPLLGRQIVNYTPFLAFGLIAWTLISQIVGEACTVFVANGHIIRQMKAPLSIYIFGMIWRNMLIFVHNMALYVLIAVLFAIYPTWATLLLIPGLALIFLNALWIGMLLGTLCTRFRDIPPIVTTIMQMMFLLTPILWHTDQVPGREAVSRFNPFYYFVELIREPLLGRAGSPGTWAVAILITLGGLAVALPLYGRFRDRIVYWL